MLSNFPGLLWVLTNPKGGNDRYSREDLAKVETPLGLSLLRYIYPFNDFGNRFTVQDIIHALLP